MSFRNDNLHNPSVFQNSRRRLKVIGTATYQWKHLIARVECVLKDGRDLFVVVKATGSNPQDPSTQDLLNAQLSTFIVSRQRFSFFGGRYRAYLRYPNHVQAEVPFEENHVRDIVTNYLQKTRNDPDTGLLPTQLVAYLLVSVPRFTV